MLRCLKILLLLYASLTPTLPKAYADFAIHRIDLPHQFSGTVIKAVAYDQAGMLWFSSSSGLHRFDGHQVISFTGATKPSIRYPRITFLYADRADNLWLGTRHGLIRFNLAHWKTQLLAYSAPENQRSGQDLIISCIFQTLKGPLIVGTQSGKLFRVQSDKLVKIFDVRTLLDTTYEDCSINQIVESRDGRLWLGTSAGRVIMADPGGGMKEAAYGNPSEKNLKISNLELAPGRAEILFTNARGAYRLNCATRAISSLETPEGLAGPLTSFFCVKDHTYLLNAKTTSSQGRLFIYDYGGNKPAGRFAIPSAPLRVASARENVALVTDGISLFRLTLQAASIGKFMHFEASINSIRSLASRKTGQLLVSSYQHQLVLENLQTDTFTKISVLHPYSMVNWNADSVLIGEEGNGLFWWGPGKGDSTPGLTPIHLNRDLPNNFIACLLKESDSSVWAGTYQGIYRVNPYTLRYQKPSTGPLAGVIGHTRITDMVLWGSRLLFSTTDGLYYLDRKDPVIHSFSEAASHQIFYNVQLADHKVWAASNGIGLVVLDTAGRFLRTLSTKDGLAGNTVFSLRKWQDFLIAGTEAGMSIIRLGDLSICNFTTADGMPSNECNTSAVLVTDDRVYIGTTDGIAGFNPRSLFNGKRTGFPLPLVICYLNVENQSGTSHLDYTLPYKSYDEIVIPAGTDFFSMSIQTLNQGATGQERSYYRLSQSEGWHEITDKNEISFVNMSPGTYHLELAAMSGDGRALKSLLVKTLRVMPFFYQTWWFKTLTGIILLVLMVLSIKAVMNFREKEIRKERGLRLQIAGDLHDEVGSMLTGISLQADYLSQKHPGIEYLQNIAGSGRSAISTMSDIVWSIDPRNDDTQSLAMRLKNYGEKAMTPAGIEFNFVQTGVQAVSFLPQRTRQNIMLVYKESLTNICKHAHATRVTVTLARSEQEMRLSVQDNGAGMDYPIRLENAEGCGLRNMRMRAESIGATLEFLSPEKGVRLVLSWKSPKNYPKG